MKSVHRDSVPSLFLDRLIATASGQPAAPALIRKQRGEWTVLRWREAVEEIDRLASGLRHLGLTPGASVAIDGEITARLFLLAAAARACGAKLVPISPGASAEQLKRAISTPAVKLIIGQGREAIASWSEASRRHRAIPIVFDHATPDNRSPDDNVTTVDALRKLATPQGWANGFAPQPKSQAKAIVWLEETTEWAEGLDIGLDRWVTAGSTIALPELLAASDRDRVEIAPHHWIASPARLEQIAKALRQRLPDARQFTGKLVDRAARGETGPGASALRWLLRRRFGLRRLAAIDVHDRDATPLSSEARHFFHSLGAPLTPAGQPEYSERSVAIADDGKRRRSSRLVPLSAAS